MAQFAKEAGAGTPPVAGVAECDTALGFYVGGTQGAPMLFLKPSL